MNRILMVAVALALSGCAADATLPPEARHPGVYREDYEFDARDRASTACHAVGFDTDDKGYPPCFHAHLSKDMENAPIQSRPDLQQAPAVATDGNRCTAYGFQPSTDGFAQCLMQQDQLRQAVVWQMLLGQ
jgi:hypothetical protein